MDFAHPWCTVAKVLWGGRVSGNSFNPSRARPSTCWEAPWLGSGPRLLGLEAGHRTLLVLMFECVKVNWRMVHGVRLGRRRCWSPPCSNDRSPEPYSPTGRGRTERLRRGATAPMDADGHRPRWLRPKPQGCLRR